MELRTYIDILARRWRVVLFVALAVICIAAIGSQFISPKYQAETRLRVITPLGGALGETNYQTTFATRLMNTYAQIATSNEVKDELKGKLGVAALPDITVKIIPDSEVIQIVVEGSDPSFVARTANTLADLLFSYQSKAVNNTTANDLSVLINRKDELKAELDQSQLEYEQLSKTYSQTTAEIAVLDRTIGMKETSYQNLVEQYEQAVVTEAVTPSAVSRTTIVALSQEIDRLEGEIADLNKQYKELLTSSNDYLQKITLLRQFIQNQQSAYSDLLYRYDTVLSANFRQENAQSIATVSMAVEPSRPSNPGHLTVLVLGVLCGLISGVIIAFVVDNLDTRIFSVDRIERVTTTSIIGSVSKFQVQLPQDTEKNPDLQRDYRLLRAKLQKLIHDGLIKTIMVTSANRREGKSTIVFRLALGLAQTKFKVLVVDADLRMPQQHKLFGVTSELGLSDFLGSGVESAKSVILRDVRPGIDLLPNLLESDNPVSLLQSPRWKNLFESFQAYDVVLLDTPALLVVPDALDFAEAADGVIIIAQWWQTTTGDLQSICSQLESVGSKLVGIIVNQFPLRKGRNSYYPKSERLKFLSGSEERKLPA
jgi:capsular exopolysaccharide synthesis family protein